MNHRFQFVRAALALGLASAAFLPACEGGAPHCRPQHWEGTCKLRGVRTVRITEAFPRSYVTLEAAYEPQPNAQNPALTPAEVRQEFRVPAEQEDQLRTHLDHNALLPCQETDLSDETCSPGKVQLAIPQFVPTATQPAAQPSGPRNCQLLDTQGASQSKPLKPDQLPGVKLPTELLFDAGSSAISPETQAKLAQAASALASHPELECLALTGHVSASENVTSCRATRARGAECVGAAWRGLHPLARLRQRGTDVRRAAGRAHDRPQGPERPVLGAALRKAGHEVSWRAAPLAALLLGCGGCGGSALPAAKLVHLSPPAPLAADAVCYRVVPSGSRLEVGVSTVVGDYTLGFSRYRGEVRAPHGDITASRLWLWIDARSLSSDTRVVADAARSSAFLDVKRFPQACFSSRRVTRRKGRPQSYLLDGELTLHGVTRGLRLPVRLARSGSRYVLLSHFSLDRGLFDIRAPGVLDAMVSDQVGVELQLVAEDCPAGGTLSRARRSCSTPPPAPDSPLEKKQ